MEREPKTLPTEDAPVELQRVEPRLFGTIPPHGILSAGGLAILVAIAVMATEHWVLGPLLLALGLVALILYLIAARHRMASRLEQRAVGSLWLCRDELRFAAGSARAWSLAGWRVLAIQRELRSLARARQGVQYELGGAVHRDDPERVAALRARMHELDEQTTARVRRIDAARRVARARVARARVPIGETAVLARPGQQTAARKDDRAR